MWIIDRTLHLKLIVVIGLHARACHCATHHLTHLQRICNAQLHATALHTEFEQPCMQYCLEITPSYIHQLATAASAPHLWYHPGEHAFVLHSDCHQPAVI